MQVVHIWCLVNLVRRRQQRPAHEPCSSHRAWLSRTRPFYVTILSYETRLDRQGQLGSLVRNDRQHILCLSGGVSFNPLPVFWTTVDRIAEQCCPNNYPYQCSWRKAVSINNEPRPRI